MGNVKKIQSSMSLSLEERIVLTGILPKQGSYEKLIVSKELSTRLQLTTDEIAKFGIVSTATQIGWNEKGKTAKFNFDLKELERLCIKDALQKSSQQESMPDSLLGLYKQFCL